MSINNDCVIELKSKIRRIPEFKGVVFWDITPLLKDRQWFKKCIRLLANHYRDKSVDVIVSNEARGFIVGAALAYELGVGFIPIRKKGKLPYTCIDLTYKKEYECDTIEIHEDAIEKNQNAWRKVIAKAIEFGIPVPAFSTALAYYDSYRSANLPANLLQAQRDYFGAHTYERIDKPRGEFFHTNWTGRGGETASSTYNV